MAVSLIHCDSFDWESATVTTCVAPGGSYSFTAPNGTGPSISTAFARTGRASLRLDHSNNAVHIPLGTAYNAFLLSFAFLPIDAIDDPIVSLRLTSATNQVRLHFGSDGTLSLVSATTLGTATPKLLFDGWNHIEWLVNIADSGSSYVYLNGVEVIAVTGVDTKAAAGAGADYVTFNGDANAGNDRHYDDLIIYAGDSVTTGDRIGDCKVAVLAPSGAGNSTGWTPLSGSNWDNVEETPFDEDTSYVSTSTASAVDTYATGNIGSTGSILGVRELVRHRKDDAGSRTIRQVLRIGTTDYEGSDIAVADSYATAYAIRTVSPATSSAFTVTELDGIEQGVKLVS